MTEIVLHRWDVPTTTGAMALEVYMNPVSTGSTVWLRAAEQEVGEAISVRPGSVAQVLYERLGSIWVDNGDGSGGVAPEVFQDAAADVTAVLGALGIRDETTPIAIDIFFENVPNSLT